MTEATTKLTAEVKPAESVAADLKSAEPVKAPEPAKVAAPVKAAAPSKPRPSQAAAKPAQRGRELQDIDFSHLRRELENIKSTSGKNLYSHIKEVFEHLILHSPNLALERFEEISYMIKMGMDPSEFLMVNDVRNYKAVAIDQESYVKKIAEHFVQPEPDEEGVIPQPDPLATQVQDLLCESKVFSYAGIGFGEQETYRLQKSIKKLAAAKPHKSIRFFGKIYGTEKDYYVVEASGEVAEEEEEVKSGAGEPAEPDPLNEPSGTGVNEMTYYVAQDSLAEWQRLPNLTYKELCAARTIKILFSGHLDREIYSNPYFFGQEKHYLRAQLSRIIHSTTLLPSGVMKLEEDEGSDRLYQVIPNEGEEDKPFVMPSTAQMAKTNMWVHAKLNILNNGRTGHQAPEDPGDLPEGEEFDPEEAKKRQEAADPYEQLLKPITSDADIKVGSKFKQACWSVRLCGDTTEYRHENPAMKEPKSNAAVVVRSLIWPGAFSFFKDGKVQQVYLGHGHKFTQETSNFPVNPPPVMEDPEEYEDGPEPTPLEAPPVEEEKAEGDGEATEDNDD